MAEELRLGQKVPAQSERNTVGAITQRIRRGTPAFGTLVKYTRPDVVFKDEEGTGADRLMAPRLRDGLERLAPLVAGEFGGVKVRVTEAWDESGEHSAGSVHYEGRGADLTTSDRDGRKLGRLARLAVDAGFDWVFFEDRSHVHVSVRKDGGAAPRGAPKLASGARDTSDALEVAAADAAAADAPEPPRTDEEIGAIIAALEDERAAISIIGAALTDEEHARLTRIQLALPHLAEARRILSPETVDIVPPPADLPDPELYTADAYAFEGPEEDLEDEPAPYAAEAEEDVAEAFASGAEEDIAEHAAPRSATRAAARGNVAVDAALAALSPLVRATSHRDALPFAFRAYYAFKAARPADVRNNFLYFVDYGFDNRTRRGYVFDMARLTVVDGPFTVAHGRGSSAVRNAVPTVFNNLPGRNACSLGLYLTQETYAFSGKSNGTPYRSIGLRLAGESGNFNSKARQRGVVAHGAPYVTRDDAGRSEGCPALEEARAQRLLPLIANGGVAFLFSPRDAAWMAGDPWVHRG